MNKTKIEWCDYTWNPIKGLCPVGCWYCYARQMYQRFGMNPEVRLDLDELDTSFPKTPSKIFVCSTFEFFHPLAEPYRNNIFKFINLESQHIFIILTKMPENIDRPMPDNVWLGVTVTGFDDYMRKICLFKHKAKIRFASYEPILTWLPSVFPMGLDWFILGRLTGHGNKKDPELNTLKNMVSGCRDLHVPLFMKNNLRKIWGKPLIQEFPE